MNCTHNWKNVEECPWCLWQNAASRGHHDNRKALEIVQRAVRIAAASLPNRQDRAKILEIPEKENNYRAIKIAYQMNQQT